MFYYLINHGGLIAIWFFTHSFTSGFSFQVFLCLWIGPPPTLWTDASGFSVDASGPLLPPIRFGQGGWGRGDVPGNGNGNAGNSPIRFRQVSDYDPFLDTDSIIAQIPCLVGSSQPSLLVYTVLHKGWISEQTVSVSGVRNVPALLPMSKYGSGLLSGTPTQCHVKCPSQTHLCQFATGSAQKTLHFVLECLCFFTISQW